MDSAVELLCSTTKLQRDKGVTEIEKLLPDASAEEFQALEAKLLNILSLPQEQWEIKHGGLMGSKSLLMDKHHEYSANFKDQIREIALQDLEDKESRVRLAAGEVMGALCKKNGVVVYKLSKDLILGGIRDNLERKSLMECGAEDQENTSKLMGKLSSSPTSEQRRGSAEEIFHDTAGWKSLETWMKCLQFVIDGCGEVFNSYIDQDLLDLIFTALTHTNRFVRETGFYVCSSLVACNTTESGEQMSVEDNAIYIYGSQFAEHVANGLADNWSQVRLAASVAARKFLLGLPSAEARQQFYATLLPPLCLNRYYVAEGVRIYNQDTWKQVAGSDGKHMVESYIDSVVAFYLKQTEADNHAVREAACACIAELGAKISKDVVRPYISKLLDALLVCFKDDSWPVRDASCVACGNFIQCFPEESKGMMEALYPLFYENLQDNIPSVRQGAAAALANVVRAYGREAADVILSKLKEGLQGVESQPENIEKYSGLDKGPAVYGVVKRLRDNDMELHTDQTMYSCGSLAPKMRRGGGCMDHQFRRPSEPWELADGCIHLMAELSHINSLTQDIGKLIPVLSKAASFQHYTQHINFLETLCKELPNIAKGVGKRMFKMFIEMFFDPVFYSLNCDNALTASAASQCLGEFSKLLGPNILKGRVEQYNPRYLEDLHRAVSMPPW